ncbi:hypothetical protein DB44_FL00090 [Candidatus Protochlamydia amoebophila]|uniref:Uncharacterized protein n=1 Tax=Candidatus Protochlamydia amoebophila TaxID=362787 RepID=A0A0C1GZ34_9BACT|nr:hypothetical protein DB44_FL00090 [Candidatus Protochlamydia amoebophila]
MRTIQAAPLASWSLKKINIVDWLNIQISQSAVKKMAEISNFELNHLQIHNNPFLLFSTINLLV